MTASVPVSGWPPAWARAVLGTAVLASLEGRSLHGYGIAQAVEARGFGRPKGGSLYPLLTSLERDGAVVAHWEEGHSGPGRRNYTLTSRGHARLLAERRAWDDLVRSLGTSATDSDDSSTSHRR